MLNTLHTDVCYDIYTVFSEGSGSLFSGENKPESSRSGGIFAFTPDDILSKAEAKREKKRPGFKKDKGLSIKKTAGTAPAVNLRDAVERLDSRVLRVAAAVLVIAAVCLIVGLTGIRLGYEVIVGGEKIGLVTSKKTVYTAVAEVSEAVKSYTGEAYDEEPAFSHRIVTKKSLSTAEQIKEGLLKSLDSMVECSGVYIDGKPAFALSTAEEAEKALAEHKKAYGGTPADGKAVEFVEKVEVKRGYMHISLLKTYDEALEMLAGKDNFKEKSYTVKDSDTLWDIANANGLTVERLLALNEGISETIKAGDVIKLEEETPLVSVRTVSTEEYEEAVPYTVEKVSDSGMYENTVAVQQQGVDGKNRVIAKITRINGKETERQKLSSEKISDPVVQIEKVGTKKRPPTTGSGTFLKPSVGSLSSRYGTRWNRKHNGIDIAGSYNSPIKAADGGVITYAGWMDGYGNYIVINHENGYQTAYGHCASLSKKVGDRVAKGDVIAKMGNTGRSTGTHLHFEVKKNGVYQNPLEYVAY